MKVIFLQDIAKLGKKHEVKDVSDGYARNFLLPRGLAKPAGDTALKAVAKEKAVAGQRAAEEKKHYENISKMLADKAIVIKTKVGERGKAFGAVTAARINDALRQENISIEKEWILLDHPIKKTGEVIIPVRFPHGITGEIRINIIGE
ncbi:MAG: 50S ribosomal protein L9 [Candidatus Sungbacteria bacterium]|nr:50S ribosomal protein L9 [Candidatus Sungbacteria bacterium]